MMINALNSGANVFMADLEDSLAPTWANVLQGQMNLRDAVTGSIEYADPRTGKQYRLVEKTAVLMVRPRGWALAEKHLLCDGETMSGSLFDFGLYLYHNAEQLLKKGTAPYFYLPKLESYHEARLWNDVFLFAQLYLDLPKSTIRATVLVETILASFELDEIIWELRDHLAGLNCGRWDYIFSYIKKFNRHADRMLPDRAQVTMTVPFMRAYTQRVVQVCHRRGCSAIGGMAAQIPIKDNPEANALALEKVKNDKIREVKDGHDGTWVAHPGLVPIAKAVFDDYMTTPNQIYFQRNDIEVTAAELIAPPQGTITQEGIRQNINVGILYLANWLNGQGCVALYHLMEDAATAEISRSQLWQWLHYGAQTAEGTTFDSAMYHQLKAEELLKIEALVGEKMYRSESFHLAIQLFDRLVESPQFEAFLTLPAYERLDESPP
jgi:malate synthase